MIKKLQHKFVFIATSAFLLVFALLIVSINVIYYCHTNQNINNMLKSISENDGRVPKYSNYREQPPKPRFDINAETEYTTRFFFIRGNISNDIENINLEYTASVDEETAKEYCVKVLKSGKSFGYFGIYKYYFNQMDNGEYLIVFLNCYRELHSIRLLLLTSTLVGILSFCFVFVLVTFFSKRAILPIAQNIERQKQFITDASHEIKTPIAIISANADVLAMQDNNEWVASIQNQASRLRKLVLNLVEMSQLDEEVAVQINTEFNLSEAVWDTVSYFSTLAKNSGKVFEKQIQDNITIKGDENAVRQIISILMDNALKYSNENGTIKLALQCVKKDVVLEVYNTCDLPSDADLERVFDRFYRLDKSRSRETGNFGIGLSIAKAIAQKHHYQISVHSDNKHSISFKIKF